MHDIYDFDCQVFQGTSFSYTHHIFKQFGQQLVTDPVKPLFSKDYDGTIFFPKNESVSQASFISWPIKLSDINRKISLGQPIDNSYIQYILDFLDSSITLEYIPE